MQVHKMHKNVYKITNEKDEQIGGFYVKQIVSRYNSSNAFSS